MDASAPAKPKKGGHAASVLLCGAIFVGAGVAAAYLAFARRVPVPLTGAGSGASPVPSLSGLPPSPRARLRWRAWGATAFVEANAMDRLVLLDVADNWSHWTKLMQLGTYGDPAVAGWINANVIPVRINRDARPDLARRYGAAVPTTALLLPTGEAIAEGSLIGPSVFVPWASRVTASYRANREALADARAKAKAAAREKKLALLGARLDGDWKTKALMERRDAALAAVRDGLASLGRAETGERRFPSPDGLRFLFELMDKQARLGLGEEVPLRAKRLLQGFAALEDKVDGGIFRYSRCADWSCPEYEKLLSVQAAAIEVCAEASRRGLGREWGALARRTSKFVERRMRLAGGAYANAVSADVETPGGWVDGARYYAGDAKAREALGRPALDRAVYSAPLAELASAYLAGGDGIPRALGLEILGRLKPGGAGLLEDELAVALARHAGRVDLHEWLDPETGGLRVRASEKTPAPGWTEPVDPDLTARAALILDDEGDPHLLDWVLARSGAVDPVFRARCALRWLGRNEVK